MSTRHIAIPTLALIGSFLKWIQVSFKLISESSRKISKAPSCLGVKNRFSGIQGYKVVDFSCITLGRTSFPVAVFHLTSTTTTFVAISYWKTSCRIIVTARRWIIAVISDRFKCERSDDCNYCDISSAIPTNVVNGECNIAVRYIVRPTYNVSVQHFCHNKRRVLWFIIRKRKCA